MRRAITLSRWLLALLLLGCSGLVLARYLHASGITDRYGGVELLRPTGKPRALVVMFADAATPAAQRQQLASRLAAAGALVATVDTERYLQRLRAAGPVNCRGLADDAERLGKQVLRQQATGVFLPPLLLGQGQGASLARQALAAASPQVLSGAVVTGSAETSRSTGLACPQSAPSAGQGVLVGLAEGAGSDALVAAARAQFRAGNDRVSGLPLVELPAPGSDRLLILLSGDGGWRELDKGLGAALQRRGVAVLGWNSLRYFWSEKKPAQLAGDLGQVISDYQRRWHIHQVALVGYSFGADVLPFAYADLPAQQRAAVRFVSLLGLAHKADFKVQVRGWLGWDEGDGRSVQPMMAGFAPQRLQCIYGAEEKDTLCPQLRQQGVDVRMRPGGHHFDRDPEALAAVILQGWQRATAQPERRS
jgi:type IV secretory pathway VirJ component